MTKKRVLVFGGSGMLGGIFSESQEDFFEIISLSHQACDVKHFPLVLNQISLHTPDVILNLAAYTDVEQAEKEGMMEVFAVNALGTQNVAKAASVFGTPLIYLSTDYVFGGEKSGGYLPEDRVNPINAYGISKYIGEELTRREYSDSVIIRTSALYGGSLFPSQGWKRNFINSILQNSQKNQILRIVDDQYTVPTSCIELSSGIRHVINNFEIYEGQALHLVSESEGVSWYEYALELKKYFPRLSEIIPISSDKYTSGTQRPKYGILKNTSKIIFPHWKDSLKSFFERG